MAGIVGQQDFWVTGSRMYFRNNADANKTLFDLGVVKTASPQIEIEKIELEDGDGGRRKTVDETVTKIGENYDVVCNNFAIDNLALLFMAAAVDDPNQSTTELTDVAHTAVIGPGKYVKLVDASGNWIYNINSIVVTDSPMTETFVEGDDWSWVSKERGMIQIRDGGAIADLDALLIDITPLAITGNRRIYPHTAANAIKGRALLVWGRNNNTEQTMREFDVSLSSNNGAFSVENYSEFTLSAQVLSDATETTAPAGVLLHAVGSLPAAPAGTP